jgi:hypothetical protein
MCNRLMAGKMVMGVAKEICWQDVPLYLLDCPNNWTSIQRLKLVQHRRNFVGDKMPIL